VPQADMSPSVVVEARQYVEHLINAWIDGWVAREDTSAHHSVGVGLEGQALTRPP